MSDLRTAAQQALEAMETVELDVEWKPASPTHKMLSKAITALRTALAESNPKPLAEWQINDLIEDLNTVDEVHGWSFRQGVYAAEKHHGVKP